MGNRFVVGIALVATVSPGCVIVKLNDKFALDGEFFKRIAL